MYTPPPDTSGWVPSAPNWYEMPRKCFACRGDDKNGRGMPEDPAGMLKCKGCKCYFHPSCARLDHIAVTVRGYEWKCDRCSKCEVCKKDDKEEHYFYCHHCNRAYHTVCLNPQLAQIPGVEWKCKKCKPTRAGQTTQADSIRASNSAAGPSQSRKHPSATPSTSGSAFAPPPTQVKRSKETSRRVSHPRTLSENGKATTSASPAPVSASAAGPSQSRSSASGSSSHASSSTSKPGRRPSSDREPAVPHAKGNRTPEEELEFDDFCTMYHNWEPDQLEAAWIAGAGVHEAAENYLVQLLESGREQPASPGSSRPPKRPRSNSNASAQVAGSSRARSSVTASPSRRKAGPGRNADDAVVSEDEAIAVNEPQSADAADARVEQPDSGTPEPLERLPKRPFKRRRTVQFALAPGTSSSTPASEQERSSSSRRRSTTFDHVGEQVDDASAASSNARPASSNFDWATQLARIRAAPSQYDVESIVLEHYGRVSSEVRAAMTMSARLVLEAQVRQWTMEIDNLKAYDRVWEGQDDLFAERHRSSAPPPAEVSQSSTGPAPRASRPTQSAASNQQGAPAVSARAKGKQRDPGPSS